MKLSPEERKERKGKENLIRDIFKIGLRNRRRREENIIREDIKI